MLKMKFTVLDEHNEPFVKEYIDTIISEYIIEDPGSHLLKSEIRNLYYDFPEIKRLCSYPFFVKKLEEKLGTSFYECKKRNEYRDKIVLEGYRLK